MGIKSVTYVFDIEVPSEYSAGIRGFTDKIVVSIESGDPGGEPGEFTQAMEQFLREWYDTQNVHLTRMIKKEV